MTEVVLVGALVLCFMNFLKSLSGRDWNGVVTQLVSWVAGVAAVLLAVHAGLTGSVQVFGHPLSSLNGFGQLVVGLQASSLFGVVHNVTAAIDSTQSAAKPDLIPPKSPTP